MRKNCAQSSCPILLVLILLLILGFVFAFARIAVRHPIRQAKKSVPTMYELPPRINTDKFSSSSTQQRFSSSQRWGGRGGIRKVRFDIIVPEHLGVLEQQAVGPSASTPLPEDRQLSRTVGFR